MSNVLDRFLRYVAIDTTSNPDTTTNPSTALQLDFGRFMVEEMKAIGIADAQMDEFANVTGTIPGNVEGAPVIGFLAHMDTICDLSGKDVKASVVHYQGGDIVLNKDLGIVMSPKMFPVMDTVVGQHLVVTDGTTLLGADDKAGIAEIMVMAETLIKDPSIPHGTIKIAFTPDEEIGRGMSKFDAKKFGADFAYTVDGGPIGTIAFENFNAAAAKVTVNGSNIHPGSSKNKMKNSIHIAMEFHGMLPPYEQPANTEGYEGFSHLNNFNGNVETTLLQYIIRDHDKEKFNIKTARFEKIAAYLNEKYGEHTIDLKLTPQYNNMREIIEPNMHLIDIAREAFTEVGATPVSTPIRGGTDGAMLCYMGLPCPNLSTGGYNAHGKYEFCTVEGLEKMVEVLIKIAEKYSKKKK